MFAREREIMNLKKGDKLKIECYKHNGYLDRTSDEATVIYNDEEVLVVANNHTTLTEHNGESHTTNEPAVLFFFKHKWFNVIGQLKKKGLFYYCNIATPFIIDGYTIKYIDYDLDLRVFPDKSFKVLDRKEYRYHKKMMRYSKELDYIIESALTELIELKKKEVGPFQENLVEKYYQIYKELENASD